jgi:hypothetical protein
MSDNSEQDLPRGWCEAELGTLVLRLILLSAALWTHPALGQDSATLPHGSAVPDWRLCVRRRRACLVRPPCHG